PAFGSSRVRTRQGTRHRARACLTPVSSLPMRNLFLAAADAARPLLDHPAVRSGWELPSALERMTVGSLTAHLTRAIAVVADNLEKPGSPPARDAAGYFINLMAVPDTDLDSELGISVRSRADAEAE